MEIKVRNIKTGEEFFIYSKDIKKIGKDEKVDVYDHDPHPGGCKVTSLGGMSQYWQCGIKPSEPIKKFIGSVLELLP